MNRIAFHIKCKFYIKPRLVGEKFVFKFLIVSNTKANEDDCLSFIQMSMLVSFNETNGY